MIGRETDQLRGMEYTVRAFIVGRDERLDSVCKTFCCMERTAYNLFRDDIGTASVKATIRARYNVKNARWIQSAINQARAVMASQEEGITYRIKMYEEKVRNARGKMERLSSQLKIRGCEKKVARLQDRIDELKAQLEGRSYPKAVFGSRRLHHQISVTRGEGRREELRAEWREKRSNHFFSVGQANQRGNGNTRLVCEDDNDGPLVYLEVRNWPGGDFTLPLYVPRYWKNVVKNLVKKAESVKLGRKGGFLEGREGLPYSVRVVRSMDGFQVLVSFELEEPVVDWSGRIAGIDINPEGIGCTIVSADGNLVATRFFGDSRFVTATTSKRKWLLENVVLKMLRWCRDTHGCNAIALEDLRLKGAFDSSPRVNFKLSNFMKRKMLQRIRLSALKMNILSVKVDPAYSSKVAISKYGRRFGGFNRHQLAAFVIARRAIGYGEAPVLDCLPRTRKERTMWNRCVRYYGHRSLIQTPPRREPLEWKNGGDVDGGGMMTKLLTAPPAITRSQTGLATIPRSRESLQAKSSFGERGGSVQTVTPAGEAELEGTELALPTSMDIGRLFSSMSTKITKIANSVICGLLLGGHDREAAAKAKDRDAIRPHHRD